MIEQKYVPKTVGTEKFSSMWYRAHLSLKNYYDQVNDIDSHTAAECAEAAAYHEYRLMIAYSQIMNEVRRLGSTHTNSEILEIVKAAQGDGK